MAAVRKEPRQIDRQAAPDRHSDDLDMSLPMLTGFTAGPLFVILDGLQASLDAFESVK